MELPTESSKLPIIMSTELLVIGCLLRECPVIEIISLMSCLSKNVRDMILRECTYLIVPVKRIRSGFLVRFPKLRLLMIDPSTEIKTPIFPDVIDISDDIDTLGDNIPFLPSGDNEVVSGESEDEDSEEDEESESEGEEGEESEGEEGEDSENEEGEEGEDSEGEGETFLEDFGVKYGDNRSSLIGSCVLLESNKHLNEISLIKGIDNLYCKEGISTKFYLKDDNHALFLKTFVNICMRNLLKNASTGEELQEALTISEKPRESKDRARWIVMNEQGIFCKKSEFKGEACDKSCIMIFSLDYLFWYTGKFIEEVTFSIYDHSHINIISNTPIDDLYKNSNIQEDLRLSPAEILDLEDKKKAVKYEDKLSALEENVRNQVAERYRAHLDIMTNLPIKAISDMTLFCIAKTLDITFYKLEIETGDTDRTGEAILNKTNVGEKDMAIRKFKFLDTVVSCQSDIGKDGLNILLPLTDILGWIDWDLVRPYLKDIKHYYLLPSESELCTYFNEDTAEEAMDMADLINDIFNGNPPDIIDFPDTTDDEKCLSIFPGLKSLQQSS